MKGEGLRRMCKKRHTQLFSESASSLVAAPPCLQLRSSSTYVLWNIICMHRDSETFGPFRGDVKCIMFCFFGDNQSYRLPRLDISKCKHSKIDWGYHKITFDSQKAKIWAKAKSFDQFHEN